MTLSSRNSRKNIVLPVGFGDHLRQLREARHLSKTDLAHKAGSTYRTVHNLESESRDRALEKTIMILANALEVSYDHLIMRDRAPEPTAPKRALPRRKLSLVILSSLIVVLAIASWSTWNFARANAEWSVDESGLRAIEPIFGLEVWRIEHPARFSFCQLAPWDNGVLIAGLSHRSPGGSCVLALDRATGEELWRTGPDLDQMTRSLGAEMMSGSPMGANRLFFLDADGDGQQEILASFIHGLFHPTALCRIDQDGTLLNQYSHKGHLNRYAVLDIDNDGKDEVVAGGVNNAPAYAGATLVVLDEDHWRGASVDSLCNAWSSEPDSSQARLIIPCFPPEYQAQFADNRLSVYKLRPAPQQDGRIFLSISVRGSQDPLKSTWVLLDDQLQIVSSLIDDSFRDVISREWPDSLRVGTGPADDQWRAAWLGTASYFGAGRTP